MILARITSQYGDVYLLATDSSVDRSSLERFTSYRIRLNIESGSSPLSVLMPPFVDDSYEVYFSGQRVGTFGKLDGIHLTYNWLPNPKLFLASPAASNIGKPVTLAIRFWSMLWEALPRRPNRYGGLRGVPLFGSSAVMQILFGAFLNSFPIARLLI